MERVETLCNLLADKLQKKAPINELLSTVKMLESELLHLKSITPASVNDELAAAVHISKKLVDDKEEVAGQIANEEEKIVEILQIDEAEVEAELEEIKKNVEEINSLAYQNRPSISFESLEDIPTFANRHRQSNSPIENAPVKEIHEVLPVNNAASINDVLRNTHNEVSDTLQDVPVKDLKKAIGINDRFLYLNELFRGDEAMYERSIKTINAFDIYPEAEFWIRRELKLKLGWDDKYETVKQFDQLIRRRFS